MKFKNHAWRLGSAQDLTLILSLSYLYLYLELLKERANLWHHRLHFSYAVTLGMLIKIEMICVSLNLELSSSVWVFVFNLHQLASCVWEARFCVISWKCLTSFQICFFLLIHYTQQVMRVIVAFSNCAGLIHIAASVGLSLLAPRKKISVMLIGNHSAGKSSFINWYKSSWYNV